MLRSEFESLVEAALEDLPPEFAKHLENVEVVVRADPSPRQLRESHCKSGSTLLGLYVGVPLTDRPADYSWRLPDQIFIFQRPLERAFPRPDDLVHQIRETVVHEVGHHFGLSDTEIYRITGEHDHEEE